MRTFKTMILTAAVAGLLLMTATGAMAAYTGLYTSSGNPDVTLGADFFHIGASQYDVNQNGRLWSADGGGEYFYGAGLDSMDAAPFAFLQTDTSLDQGTIDAITFKLGAFATTSLVTVRTAAFFGTDPIPTLKVLAKLLFTDLQQYNLAGAGVGYGFFYENGDKFDVTMGSLDQAGLVAMFDGTGTNTYTKATPIPGAIWLLGSGLVGLAGLRRRMRG